MKRILVTVGLLALAAAVIFGAVVGLNLLGDAVGHAWVKLGVIVVGVVVIAWDAYKLAGKVLEAWRG